MPDTKCDEEEFAAALRDLDKAKADRIQKLRARLIEVERELFAPGHYSAAHILSRDAGQRVQRREEHFGRLSAERGHILSELGGLAPEGMASGKSLAFARSPAATVYAHNFVPEPEVSVRRDAWDWSEE